mmetsp:Transcript_7758/g.12792  ORF Transcript_7758/g.12792 Transcript_7758/m.12792 type:complete len:90 (+) Transcript_7758:1-270(+)
MTTKSKDYYYNIVDDIQLYSLFYGSPTEFSYIESETSPLHPRLIVPVSLHQTYHVVVSLSTLILEQVNQSKKQCPKQHETHCTLLKISQ